MLYFIFSAYGLTQLLIYGTIFNKIRPKNKFFHCPMCLGFHIGYILYFIFRLNNIILFEDFISGAFLCGCISSGTSYILCRLFDDEGLKIRIVDKCIVKN